MAIGTAMAMGRGVAGVGIYSANKRAKQMRRSSQAATNAQLEFQREQQAILEKQKAKYRQFQFVNPYKNMENAYEDLTVNQQQAMFMSQQGAQQRADIMEGLRGAAGTSGIAGLAQTLANQGQLQAQQISATIGQQEAMNQRLAAQGAAAADMAERGGEGMVQQAEMDRQATLLGVAYGGAAGANAGVQQAYANQMQAGVAAGQMQASAWTSGASMIAGLPT